MLVLTRKSGEEVVIEGIVRIAVLEIRGKQVRLGITAPADIAILRQELCPIAADFAPSGVSPSGAKAIP